MKPFLLLSVVALAVLSLPTSGCAEPPRTEVASPVLPDIGRDRAVYTAAFDALVVRHQKTVQRVCYRFTGNAEDAADLADVLAEHDDPRVGLHLRAQRVAHGFDDVHDAHDGPGLSACAPPEQGERWSEELLDRDVSLGKLCET